MKLYAREFLRSLRRGVRRELKSHPEWRKTARRIRRRRGDGKWALYFWRGGTPLGFLALAISSPPAHGLWLALIWWTMTLTFWRAGQFQGFFSPRGGARVFLLLPVTTSQVLDYGRWLVLRSSLWLIADALVVLAYAVVAGGAPHAAWWGVLPVALLIWLSGLATAIILLWRWPRANYSGYASWLFMMAVGMTILLGKAQILSFAQLKGVFAVLVSTTPPGWACQVAMWLAGERPAFPVVAAGLLALWLAFAVPCYRALADRFAFWEPDRAAAPPMPEEDPGGRHESTEARQPGGSPAAIPSRVSEVEDYILQGGFLKPYQGLRLGWLERLILSFFPRQATLLDFLLTPAPGWSSRFRLGWLVLVGGCLLAWFLEATSPVAAGWIVGVSLFLAPCNTTPLLGGKWKGFFFGPMAHRRVHVLALLPVSLREVRRLILAVNGLRFLLALPCWMAVALIIGHLGKTPPLESMRVGAESWLVALLLQPIALVFKYSPGTNDTSNGCMVPLVIVLWSMFVLAAVIAAAVVISAPAAPIWHVAVFLGLATVSFGGEAGYRRLYAGQNFDLLSKNPVG